MGWFINTTQSELMHNAFYIETILSPDFYEGKNIFTFMKVKNSAIVLLKTEKDLTLFPLVRLGDC